ncbi:MAG: glycosyl transferase [Bacteroidetes bacterium]|nr:MAG: glycosyl transferase [Bacteroidota bacterium]
MYLLKLLFWASLIIVFYSYVGYGFILWAMLHIKKIFTNTSKGGVNTFEPFVTLIVTAYNEQDFIEKKIQNTLDLNYPQEKIQRLFVTDGSSDQTPDIIRKYTQIRLLHLNERRGKVAAMHRAMGYVEHPIVIFCDANTLLNADSIKEIVKHYADPTVGGVAGEKKILKTNDSNIAGAGEGLYWKYESFLKKLDAEFYTVVGAAGELFSVRTALYENCGDHVILDDFVISLKICQKGYRFQYEPGAYAMETPSMSIEDEQKRKIRISAGAFQAMYMLRDLLNVFKYPKLSFQYISHRVLRWSLCPLCLILLLIANLFLVIRGAGTFYQWAFICQLVFYVAAVGNSILIKNNMNIKALYVPYYFLFMNLSLIQGFARFMRGRQTVLWEKAQREKMESTV